jgi:hypothetical protein
VGPTRKKTGTKKSREFRRHHHFDDKRQYWVRNVDQVPLIDDSVQDRRFYLASVGWLLFILWEAYWLWEIRARFVESGSLQLPYMFLFFILVVVPLAWYLFLRRKLRRLAMIPHDLRTATSLPVQNARRFGDRSRTGDLKSVIRSTFDPRSANSRHCLASLSHASA